MRAELIYLRLRPRRRDASGQLRRVVWPLDSCNLRLGVQRVFADAADAALAATAVSIVRSHSVVIALPTHSLSSLCQLSGPVLVQARHFWRIDGGQIGGVHPVAYVQ